VSATTSCVFTPWRENEPTPERDDDATLDALEQMGYRVERPWLQRLSDTYSATYHLEAARERDRDNIKGPWVPLWSRLDGCDMDRFERWGRRYVRIFALDGLCTLCDGKVRRGGAIGVKPDEAWQDMVRRWWKIQGPREDLQDLEDLDVPLRTVLGGKQVFTPWRENEDAEDWDDYVRELKKETHKRPKGYAAWRPQKKTTRLIMQVKEVLEEYQDHLPLTARQIFYRLVAAYGYPKTEKAAKNLSEHLVRARRAGMIPFDHIRDDGISIMAQAHYRDENAFFKHVHDEAKEYKRDKLARQGLDIRVYCEAAGMMPQLERVCEPYSVPVYSCSGFDSL
jgi:hypothetical protein